MAGGLYETTSVRSELETRSLEVARCIARPIERPVREPRGREPGLLPLVEHAAERSEALDLVEPDAAAVGRRRSVTGVAYDLLERD